MICYVLAMGKQHLDRTWLWDTALKFFGRAFSLRHQITWRGKLSFFAYVISGERSTNRPKQLRNDAFHVKTSQSAKN